MRSWMHGPLSWNLRRNGFAPVRVSILDGLRDHIRWWVESGDPGAAASPKRATGSPAGGSSAPSFSRSLRSRGPTQRVPTPRPSLGPHHVLRDIGVRKSVLLNLSPEGPL